MNFKLLKQITFFILATFVFIVVPRSVAQATFVIDYPTNNLGMVGYWTLNGPDMLVNIRDVSGQGNHGFLMDNSTTTVAGKSGQAMYFGQATDHVDLGDLPAIESVSQATWALWVRPAELNGIEPCYLCKGNLNGESQMSWAIQEGTAGFAGIDELFIRIPTTGTDISTLASTDNSVIAPDRWTHIIVVFDGSQPDNSTRLKVYINGVQEILQFVDTIPATLLASTANARIGSSSDGARNINASMDDVRIYNRALTAAEALRLYDSTAGDKINSRRDISQNFLLFGYWSFDGPDSIFNISDRSGFNSHGKLSFGSVGNISTTTVSGKVGQAYSFDGLDDIVTVADPDLIEDISSMTVSAWVKSSTISNAGSTKGIVTQSIGANDPFALVFFSDNKFAFQVNTGSTVRADADAVLADLNWHHYVGVYDGSKAILYIDGVAQADQPAQTGNIIPSANPITFGAYDSGTFFQGDIDEVRIYPRALPASEVGQLYRNGTALIATTNADNLGGVVAHWSFDGKDIYNNISDLSGNGNHGFLNGQTSTTTAMGKMGQAINLKETADYIDVGDMSAIESVSRASWSLWVKPGEFNATEPCFICKGNFNAETQLAWSIQEGTTGFTGIDDIFVRIPITNTDTSTLGASDGNILSPHNWTHIVVVFDGTQADNATRLKIYANGVQQSMQFVDTIPATILASTANARIGGSSDSVRNINSIIDDIRIYNKALTQDEITKLYIVAR